MAELFLSAFFDVLFDRLASRDLLGFIRQLLGGVDSEIITWERKFKMIQAVLTDAEEKQLTDKAVKLWLDDLQDLAYDAEDILDDFATQALEQNLIAKHNQDSSRRDLSFIPVSLNPSAIMSNYSMASKIKDITSRLEQLCQEKVDLGLQRIPGGTSSTAAAQRRPLSSSVPTESTVFGRLHDKAKILDLVCTDTPSDHASIAVIPIVGMGGVGKTTLARDVYNDVKASKFDVKAWVCVSDVFDVLGISKALLESITSSMCDLNTLEAVQVRLRKEVDGKRILVVLDDVWNEDYCLWEELKAPFLAAAPNSKIIVTTRHSSVALTMEPTPQYKLQGLSDEDCWSLFKLHASILCPAQFRKKVVRKCGGLPLAAKTLGGLLRSKRHDAWDAIFDSNILHQSQPQKNGILPVLRLSYHYLPSHLKRCFAYCAIFPKDYEFEKSELVLLWMAEGLIQQSKDNKQLEEWGRECFEDLVSRSIFEKSSVDGSKFVMHDLVHDLAQIVVGETILTLEEANKSSRRFDRVRHSSFNWGGFRGKNKFEVLHKVEHLRTFLPLKFRGYYGNGGYITSMYIIDQLLPKFKKLRVLSLEGYSITELPSSIGDLKLLRYLNLASTAVISLPESTSSLTNLLILILRNCHRLTKLPSKMRKLINLRHLDIESAILLEEMPLGMKELKNLRKLSNFIVGKGGSISGLKDLKNLNFIGGEVCISGLENVKNSNDAKDVALQEKQNLEKVSLKWVSQLHNPRNEVEDENVLDMLQPHKSIKVLSIEHYVGARFPQWIGDPSFTKMEHLTLQNCENCTSLPSLGLLGSLKHLIIKGMKKIKSIGSEFYGKDCSKPFQSLETLSFEDLQEWECWDINSKENCLDAGFSNLRELSIVECRKLSGKLPEELPSLETLVVDKCSELIVSFSSYPALSKLEIDECKGLVCSTVIDASLVKRLVISNISLDIYGCKGMMHNDCTAAESMSVTITNTLEFGKFLKQGFQLVETLWIGESQQIKSWLDSVRYQWMWIGDSQILEPELEQGIHVLTLPSEVSIEEGCVRLAPFPEINFYHKNMRFLKIGQCRALKSLPEEIIGSNSKLEYLCIRECDSLTSIERRKLPSSLKCLEVQNCKMLRHLVDGEEYASSPSCSSSSSSSVMLKHLEIERCPELTSLSLGIQSLKALEELFIWDCLKLESIPNGLDCLKRIDINNCPSIVSLPNDMHKLNFLEESTIYGCPSIESFPEEGFPTNLRALCTDNVKVNKALIEWGLHRLTSLRSLTITGCDDAEEMEMMLPASLTYLNLNSWSKLKCLSSTCFQSLASLQSLIISDCPNLTSFPEEGLPSSLRDLCIRDCPKLKKECKRDKGKEWSKIGDIQIVQMI